MPSELFIKKKRCPSCGKELEPWFFNRASASADGLQSYCKDCQRIYHIKHPHKEFKQHRKSHETLDIWKSD
ncbi:MAG: hypothetical protein ACI3YI_05145 [Bacteroidaceae bacterium]